MSSPQTFRFRFDVGVLLTDADMSNICLQFTTSFSCGLVSVGSETEVNVGSHETNNPLKSKDAYKLRN